MTTPYSREVSCDFLHYAEGKATLHFAKYPNGRIALQLTQKTRYYEGGDEIDEPLMTASVNLPNEPCELGEVYIKDWSENAGASECLVFNSIINEVPIGMARCGYSHALRYALTSEVMQKLREHGFFLSSANV